MSFLSPEVLNEVRLRVYLLLVARNANRRVQEASGLRMPTCLLCRWIVEDLTLHGRLTEDHPPQGPIMMNPLFPIHAKICHLILERFANISLDGAGVARILGVD